MPLKCTIIHTIPGYVYFAMKLTKFKAITKHFVGGVNTSYRRLIPKQL